MRGQRVKRKITALTIKYFWYLLRIESIPNIHMNGFQNIRSNNIHQRTLDFNVKSRGNA